MRLTALVLGVVVACAGCVYEPEGGGVVGGFRYREMLVTPAEEWWQDGGAFEVCGFAQHTEFFAMEYGAGYQHYEDKDFSRSRVTGGALRVTATYSDTLAPGFYLSAGAGMTLLVPEYKVGYDELKLLESQGVFNYDVDFVDPVVGVHLQVEASYAAPSGFTVGLFMRQTFANAAYDSYWDDGISQDDESGEMDLGSFEVGLTIGANL